MPAFRMIMMTIKRTRNLNQTIDLVSTSEEAEIMPNGGRYDKEKSITPGHSDHQKDPSGRENFIIEWLDRQVVSAAAPKL